MLELVLKIIFPCQNKRKSKRTVCQFDARTQIIDYDHPVLLDTLFQLYHHVQKKVTLALDKKV